MSKVMLIMDKPDACIECPLCFKAEEISIGAFEYRRLYSCKRVPEDVEDIYLEDILHKKPDWCPLKDVPNKIENAIGDMDYYKAIGFNACINEILKENGKNE